MLRVQSPHQSRSSELLQALSGYDEILVVMHDNPDPDAIAAGWGVYVLCEELLSKQVRLVCGGAIERAENRRLVELLAPPIQLVDRICLGDKTATVLVDCDAHAGNQLLARAEIMPTAVIDHHLTSSVPHDLPFCDLRKEVAAAASIVANYLREQMVEPGPKLSTAMLYALKTETSAGETEYSSLDRFILPWLTERGDPSLLAEIENAPLPQSYYGDLLIALQGTILYEDAAFCWLPQGGPEVGSEVADLLIRCESVRRVLCVSERNEDFYCSALTDRCCRDAVELLQQTLQGLGRSGGHANRAGGKIEHVKRLGDADEVVARIRKAWLAACRVQDSTGAPLCPIPASEPHL